MFWIFFLMVFFFAISVNILVDFIMPSMYSWPLKVLILIGIGAISTILYNYIDYAIKIYTI